MLDIVKESESDNDYGKWLAQLKPCVRTTNMVENLLEEIELWIEDWEIDDDAALGDLEARLAVYSED